jgi:hypothetical protein
VTLEKSVDMGSELLFVASSINGYFPTVTPSHSLMDKNDRFELGQIRQSFGTHDPREIAHCRHSDVMAGRY